MPGGWSLIKKNVVGGSSKSENSNSSSNCNSNDSSLAVSINVGLRSFKANESSASQASSARDFTLAVHFRLGIGDEWTVIVSYAQLKFLDALVSRKTKKMVVTPFPIVDRHLYSILLDAYSAPPRGVKYSNQQQLAICSVVTSKFGHWIHMIIARYHLFPTDVKFEINRCFALSVKFMDDLIDTEPSNSNNSKNSNSNNSNNNSSDLNTSFFSSSTSLNHNAESVRPSFSKQNSGLGSSTDTASVSSRRSNETFPQSTSQSQSSHVLGGKSSEVNTSEVGDRVDNLMRNEPPLMVTVKRGNEGQRNRIEYEVMVYFDEITFGVRRTLKPKTVYHRYNDFKELWKDLQANQVYSVDRINQCTSRDNSECIFLLSKFPLPPISCSLGIALGEKDLANRTRYLDLWLREVCSIYYLLNKEAKALIKAFFDLRPVAPAEQDSIYLDLLAKGMVEGPRAEVPLFLMMNISAPDKGGGRKSISGRSEGDALEVSAVRRASVGGGASFISNRESMPRPSLSRQSSTLSPSANTSPSNGSNNTSPSNGSNNNINRRNSFFGSSNNNSNNNSNSNGNGSSISTIQTPPGSPMSKKSSSTASASPKSRNTAKSSRESMDESRHSEYDNNFDEEDDDGKAGSIPFISGTVTSYTYVNSTEKFKNMHWKDMSFEVINAKASHRFPYLDLSYPTATQRPDIWRSFLEYIYGTVMNQSHK